jgi:hypothetical protein
MLRPKEYAIGICFENMSLEYVIGICHWNMSLEYVIGIYPPFKEKQASNAQTDS